MLDVFVVVVEFWGFLDEWECCESEFNREVMSRVEFLSKKIKEGACKGPTAKTHGHESRLCIPLYP